MSEAIIIPIPKRASGSKPDVIGDGTLLYTENVSDYNKSLTGLFNDNPPVLARHHASLVWRYNHNLDRYILIHVQGSQVVSEALARYYPFRAGYEVSRDDMNKLDFSLSSFVAAVPRIATMQFGRVSLNTQFEKLPTYSNTYPSDKLGQNIIAAIVKHKRLLVEIDPDAGGSWREDGIFECAEFKMLLRAIDNIAIKIRRYVTFAFCVDENFERVLNGVSIIFYRRGCNLKKRDNDISMTWIEAITTSSLNDEESQFANHFPYPGDDDPLMSPEELEKAYDLFSRTPGELAGNDWHIWLNLGHKLETVQPNGWTDFASYYDKMPTDVKSEFAAQVHAASLTWDIDGFNKALFVAMNVAQPYTDREMRLLQSKALDEYLSSGEIKYRFLFEGGISDELLKSLGDHRLRFPNLNRAVDFMNRYPSVPPRCFVEPENIYTIPKTKELSLEHAKLVDGWVKKAKNDFSFQNLQAVIDQLAKVKSENNSIATQKLKEIREADFKSLLANSQNLTWNSLESLLEKMLDLPDKSSWNGFKETVSTVLNQYLFGQNGILSHKLMNVDKWADLAKSEDECPQVMELILNALHRALENVQPNEFARLEARIKEKYGKRQDEHDHRLPLEADCMVEGFIEFYEKKDKEKAKELEDMLNFSKREKNALKYLAMGALAGMILGLALGYAGYKLCHKGPQAEGSDLFTSVMVIPQEKPNLMLLLASLPDSVNEVHMDSMAISMDSVRNNFSYLLYWNDISLKDYEKMDSARIVISPMNANEAIVDTLPHVINKNNTLFNEMLKYGCKVDTVAVMYPYSVTISIPNDSLMSMGTDSVQIKPSEYYFKLINYIEQNLPTDKGIKLPY